ncbi:hypothetical protein NPIL_70711 [Nephila pilipes]|uniref:Uncharacterized protein n=1 Tax=Nephila pilipes TaxID=299642 RepID=A0A8X6PX83_NEPPI|nr:hypothetical protein NPIL_70711 [Nephila pilipes]
MSSKKKFSLCDAIDHPFQHPTTGWNDQSEPLRSWNKPLLKNRSSNNRCLGPSLMESLSGPNIRCNQGRYHPRRSHEFAYEYNPEIMLAEALLLLSNYGSRDPPLICSSNSTTLTVIGVGKRLN